MKRENQSKLNCKNAKNASVIETLARLGFLPAKKTEKEAWFASPFRLETKPSFKVDLRLNRWFDHGEGKGGNVIDLVILISGYSVRETLDFLSTNNNFSFQQPTHCKTEQEPSYTIKKVKVLENTALIAYLESRGISFEISSLHCQEMYYSMKGKRYFAVAFQNNLGGYELRNKYFKGCLGKKATTQIQNGSNSLVIFEGFLDYLTYRELFQDDLNEDFLILNSISQLETSWELLANYETINCFLDNDRAGNNATDNIKKRYPFALDCSTVYKGMKDLNDYLISHPGQKPIAFWRGL